MGGYAPIVHPTRNFSLNDPLHPTTPRRKPHPIDTVPDTLPAGFNQWDPEPPDTLPANFQGWDEAPRSTRQANTQALNPLVERIRAKYPGVYDDLNDAELTKRVLAKYPEYSDLAAPANFKGDVFDQAERGDVFDQAAAQPLRDFAAERPGVPRPTDPVNYVNPVPTENIPIVGPMVQPFAETYENLRRDPKFAMDTYRGAKAGAMAATAPLAVGASIPQLVGGGIGGTLGSVGGQKLARTFNLGDTEQEISGDVGGLAGGVLGGIGADAFAKNVSPNIGAKLKATGKVLGQEAVSHVPFAGRIVRRPSAMDYLNAILAKAPEPEPVYSKVRLGPDAPPPEIGLSKGLGGYVSPEPLASGLGKIPVAPDSMGLVKETPNYQKLGIKTSRDFKIPPVREPVPLEHPAAVQQAKPFTLETPEEAPHVPTSAWPPPSRIFRTEPDSPSSPDVQETRGIQEQMREQFDRDEAANEADFLKQQAKGYAMDVPKSVRLENMNKALGKRVPPRQSHEYGYQKPSEDLTGILQESLRQEQLRKASARR